MRFVVVVLTAIILLSSRTVASASATTVELNVLRVLPTERGLQTDASLICSIPVAPSDQTRAFMLILQQLLHRTPVAFLFRIVGAFADR